MEADKVIIIVAFLVGTGCSLYILSHLKQVVKHASEWRAASIAALCVSAFLFFAISHPKISKVVADVLGAKVEVSALNKKIDEKQKIADDLDNQIASARSKIAELQKKMEESITANMAQSSKPMSESLKEYEREGRPVAVFSGNQVAVNPKLGAKVAGVKEIPERFKSLSPDSWIIIENKPVSTNEMPNSAIGKGQAAAMASSTKSSAFILNATGETKQVEPLTKSETIFLRNIIKKNSKSTGPSN